MEVFRYWPMHKSMARHVSAKEESTTSTRPSQALRSIIHKLESQLDSSIAKVYTSINGQSLRTLENSVSRTLDEEQIISQELVDEMCDDNLNMPLSDQTILDVVPQEYRMDNNTLQTDPVGVKTAHVVGQYLNIVATFHT